MSAPVVVAEDLVKVYPKRRGASEVRALDGLSFVANEGMVLGLLGPNGAGKSTAMRILTALTAATEGRASVAGLDVASRPELVRTAIGVVSQGPGTDPLLTATESLEIAGRLRGLSRADSRVRAASLLAEFGLAEFMGRQVGTFSGGMRRRLDVAVALMHRPRVLFLDEPTTGLDPAARATMWTEIRRLAGDEQLTVMLITHDMDEADRLADGIVLVDRGKAVTHGTPESLKASLHGDTIQIGLVEPDAEAVRAVTARLPQLREVVVETHGVDGVLSARVDDGAAAVGAVVAALDAAGVRYSRVSASHPSLDDVYLHFVGRTYRGTDEATLELEGVAA